MRPSGAPTRKTGFWLKSSGPNRPTNVAGHSYPKRGFRLIWFTNWKRRRKKAGTQRCGKTRFDVIPACVLITGDESSEFYMGFTDPNGPEDGDHNGQQS